MQNTSLQTSPSKHNNNTMDKQLWALCGSCGSHQLVSPSSLAASSVQGETSPTMEAFCCCHCQQVAIMRLEDDEGVQQQQMRREGSLNDARRSSSQSLLARLTAHAADASSQTTSNSRVNYGSPLGRGYSSPRGTGGRSSSSGRRDLSARRNNNYHQSHRDPQHHPQQQEEEEYTSPSRIGVISSPSIVFHGRPQVGGGTPASRRSAVPMTAAQQQQQGSGAAAGNAFVNSPSHSMAPILPTSASLFQQQQHQFSSLAAHAYSPGVDRSASRLFTQAIDDGESTLWSPPPAGRHSVVGSLSVASVPDQQQQQHQLLSPQQRSATARVLLTLFNSQKASSTMGVGGVEVAAPPPQPQPLSSSISAAACNKKRLAQAMDKAHMLGKLHASRLSQRYFHKWSIHALSRQRRGVFSISSAAASSSSSGGTMMIPSRVGGSDSSRSQLLVQQTVQEFWAVHEEHNARVKSLLEGLATSAATAVPAAASVVQQNLSPHTSEISAAGSPRRPLGAMVRLQSGLSLAHVERQEQMDRRSIAQLELEQREHIEMSFHSPQSSTAAPYHSSSIERPIQQPVAAYVAKFSTGVNNSDVPQVSIARHVAKEENGRRLVEISQSNAWITVQANMDQMFATQLQREAELRAPIMRTRSSSTATAVAVAAAAASPTSQRALTTMDSTSSTGGVGQQTQQQTPLRGRSSSTVRFTDEVVAEQRVSSPVTAATAASVRISSSTIRSTPSRSASFVQQRQTTNSNNNESDNNASHSPSSSPSPRLRRAQSTIVTQRDLSVHDQEHSHLRKGMDDGVLTDPSAMVSDELKGRKAVIREYKAGLQRIVDMFSTDS